MRLTVHPLLPRAGASASGPELRLRLKRSADGAELHSQTAVLEPTVLDAVEADGPAPQAYVPVTLAVPLPQQEGAYDIELEAVERNGLRWSRSVASRTVQVVAVADAVADAPAGGDWRVLYELDPGSPKLLERLRRLPGMGMPSISMPGVSMPKMPLPSFAMPKMPLPNVSVPKLPSVNSMVPRLTGLLSVGHSTLETHPLGPMLRLPPTAADKPAWEGIGLAGTEPGLPHLVAEARHASIRLLAAHADAAAADLEPLNAFRGDLWQGARAGRPDAGRRAAQGALPGNVAPHPHASAHR